MKTKTFKNPLRKTKAGGMSAKRYQRNRDQQMADFFQRVGQYLNDGLLPIINEVDAIVIGGNTVRAKDFLKRGGLDYRLVQKVHPEVIIAPVSEDGLYQAMKEIGRIMKDHDIAKEQQAWDEFIVDLMRDRATYGKEAVIDALQQGRVKQMLVHESKLKDVVTAKDTIIFSSETETGNQLLSFSGIAAILRY